MTRTTPLLALLLLLPGATAQPAPTTEQLLAKVPPRTAFVLVAPRLDNLVSNLASFGKKIGADELAELTPALLLERAGLLEHAEGLDIDGPLVVAQSPEYAVPLALCVVRDAEAWKKAVQAETMNNGLLRVRLCHAGGYAAIEENVLILGDEPDAVRAAVAADETFALRFAQEAGPLLADHQFVCWVDLPPWRPRMEAVLAAMRLAMQMSMAMNAPPDESMRRVVNALVSEITGLIREMDSLAVGIRGGADGIRLHAITRFREGGPVATYLDKAGKGRGHLLRGLPDAPAILIASCEWEKPPGTDSLTLRWLKSLFENDEVRARVGEEQYKRALQASIDMNNRMSGYNFTMSAGGPDGGLLITGVYFADDPTAFMGYMRDAFEFNAEFLSPVGPGTKTKVTSRTEQIAGHEVTAYDMAFDVDDPQLRQTVQALYGRQPSAYAAARAQDVFFVMGPTRPSRQRVEQLLDSAGRPLTENPRVAAVCGALSPEPQCYALLDLVEFLKFVLATVRCAGAPVPPLEWSDEPAPYAGLALYFEPGRIRTEAYVPAEPVRRIISAITALKTAEPVHRP
ncbi:MAG: hypothetical protein PVJ57_11000 [Phycisphaerae bacterium]|jgi:hypothetical protein